MATSPPVYVMVEPCPVCDGVIEGVDITYGWKGDIHMERAWEPDGPWLEVPHMFLPRQIRDPDKDVILVTPCRHQVSREWWYRRHEFREIPQG